MGYPLTTEGIQRFLADLKCKNAKACYYRAIRAFCNWAVRNGYLASNPIEKIDAPKCRRPLLPSLTREQINQLIEQAGTLRNRAIVSLFADSGVRLSELARISVRDINWQRQTVKVWGKGGSQREAPFSGRTALLLKELATQNGEQGSLWNIGARGIQSMLRRLKVKTGLPCTPHTFRRSFASNLHRVGLDIEHIMRLGGWRTLQMVLRYTESVKSDESLALYRRLAQGTSTVGDAYQLLDADTPEIKHSTVDPIAGG